METYSANDDILKESYSVFPLTEEAATRIVFSYAYNYSKSYFIESVEVADQEALDAFKKEYLALVDLVWIRDDDTALDIAEKLIARKKNLQKKVAFGSAMRVLENDLTDDIQVDHFAGPVLSDVRITGISIDLDNLSVNIEGVSE
ncbi:MAG: hypothetical protein KJ737_16670 [Proteobacteria bacterium]|nr:hypothetical protein [Pseudomonadota bacterium]